MSGTRSELPRERLAIFMPTLRGGGAQRSMVKLASELAERGHHVDMVLGRPEGPYLEELHRGVRVVDLEARRALLCVPGLIRYLRGERPRALLAVLDYANLVAIAARWLSRTGVRLAISERNTLSVMGGQTRRLRGRLVPRLARLLYGRADAIVAVSEGVADDLARLTRLPRERIDVIYNPVITPQLRERAREPLEHEWFADGAPPVLLAVGRLSPQKDFGCLIRAFARLKQEREARLLILGEGGERDTLERLSRELGVEADVGLPGFVSNPYPYMRAARAFVLSSRWEGLPGVLIEALACGTRLISTDCPSGPREVLAGGRYGRLVPVGDQAALATAMREAIDGEFGPAPDEACRPYEPEQVVARYLEVLHGDDARARS